MSACSGAETLSEPLVFLPVYKDYLWGGDRIPALYRRAGAPSPCAESWEISAHPDGPGIVARGPLAGERLDALARRFGARLTGTRAPDPGRFPLLIKLIDARLPLSVQVHPGEKTAPLSGGEPKTEMWAVLDAAPGASICAGPAPGIGPGALRRAVEAGDVDRQIARHPVGAGDAVLIPGGLVHSIGAGCLIYEVQQSANTTFRLFDWNRVGKDGRPRPLHIDAAFRAIDWTLPPPRLRRRPAGGAAEGGGRPGSNRWSVLVSCPFFTVRELLLERPLEIVQDGSTFHAWFAAEGGAELSAGGAAVPLAAGASALVPAAAPSFRIAPSGPAPARLLATTLGG